MLAADYPFMDIFWSMFVFFIWIMWFMLLFRVFGDIFRRDDLSGLGKTGWLVFTILLPFLGVFIYILSQNDGMTQRDIDRARAHHAQFESSVRSASSGGDVAGEIERAKKLLDTGAITQAEFDAIKAKALG